MLDEQRLGLLTGTLDLINGHPRLLRSLGFGDDDYLSCVVAVVPAALGQKGHGRGVSFDNLAKIERSFGLEAWLKEHQPELHHVLYVGGDEAAVHELQDASEHLGIPDIERHASRIKRGLREDPAQAVGSSKDLLETVMKGILGLHGSGPETKLDLPKLVHQVGLKLDLHPAGLSGSVPGAAYQRKILSALNQIVSAAGELRNAGFGTGHGGSRQEELDIATARLVVAAAVAVATFYVEVSGNEAAI